MIVIKQQSATVALNTDSHRNELVVSKITVRTVRTLGEAHQLVYNTYANNDYSSHYAVLSENGKFLKTIKFGTLLDGLRSA